MKNYYHFLFFSNVCSSFNEFQVCDTKIGRPKKIAGNLSDPKNKHLRNQKNLVTFQPNKKKKNERKEKIGQASLSKF